MSETGKPVHITDVLTSIRRLVDDEGEAGGNAVPPKDAGQDDARLVLGPALRIPEQGEAEEPVDAPDAAEQAAPDTDDGWKEVSLSDRVLLLEQAMAAASGAWGQGAETDGAGHTLAPLKLTSPLKPEPAASGLDQAQLEGLIAQTVQQQLEGSAGEAFKEDLLKVLRREIARSLAERDIS